MQSSICFFEIIWEGTVLFCNIKYSWYLEKPKNCSWSELNFVNFFHTPIFFITSFNQAILSTKKLNNVITFSLFQMKRNNMKFWRAVIIPCWNFPKYPMHFEFVIKNWNCLWFFKTENSKNWFWVFFHKNIKFCHL